MKEKLEENNLTMEQLIGSEEADKYKLFHELRYERNMLMARMNDIRNLKYKHTNEFLKMGSIMCQLIDTQYAIMSSYCEILTARIMYIEENGE